MQLGGRYQIVGVLGTGGFGTVYRARFRGEGGFSKEVALKVLNPHLDSAGEFAARLRDEARMLGLLRHRAIVTVDRLLYLDDRWIIVMEYIEGVDLAEVLRVGPLPPGPALEIAAEVAGALNAAWHQPGEDGRPLHLLHRDIKPANLRLTAMGEVKILDFGIARAEFEGREGQSRSMNFGSMNYMAPERLEAAAGGPASDIYALGAVLYEMLCGRPFGRTSVERDWHDSHLHTAMQHLRATPGVEDQLAQLVAEALAADPAARPSAADFEQRALTLRLKASGELLRYWAERALGPLVAARAAELESLGPEMGNTTFAVTGSSEAAHAVDVAVPAPEPPRPRSRAPALLAALALALVLLVAGGLVGDPHAPELPKQPLSEADPPPVSAPAPALAAPALAAPAAPPEAPPLPSPMPVPPQAKKAKTKATPAPPEPAPVAPRATVALSGDAQSVELRGDRGTFSLPGEVPPGDYRIWATFSGGAPVGAGSLHVEDGATLTLRCAASFGKCTTSP